MRRIPDIPVYLDYNATTPVAAEVVAAMAPFWMEQYHNPSSPYPEAARVRAAVEDARAAVAALLGAESDTIVFTSGGTESDHWALEAGVAFWRGTRRKVIASAVEHPAVTETLRWLESQGVEVVQVPTDEHGIIRLDILDQCLDPSTAMVSVMLANNEVGTRQPIEEVARRAHAIGALVHTDAAQAVGKIAVDVRALDVDLLTVVGHKFYAPKGIGALYIRRGLDLPAGLPGGGQEGGRRSGTENVPAIVGLGEAARLAATWLASGGPQTQAALRDELQARLTQAIPKSRILGEGAPRLGNTLALVLPGLIGMRVLQACTTLRAATGSACHSNESGGSKTLQSMGIPPEWAQGFIRLSLGRETTAAMMDRAAMSLISTIQTMYSEGE